MEVGQAVKIVKIDGLPIYEEADLVLDLEEYIGSVGVIAETEDDGYGNTLYYLDLDTTEEMLIPLYEHEIEPIKPKGYRTGGDSVTTYFYLTPSSILKQDHLSRLEKLILIGTYYENPSDLDYLCEITHCKMKTVLYAVGELMNKNYMVASKTQRNVYFLNYSLDKYGGMAKATSPKKDEEKEKTVVTEAEGNLLLLMKVVEEYYKKRGVAYKISKKGKKHLKKAVTFLDKTWKDEDTNYKQGFATKEELYASYVDYVFKDLDSNSLSQLKRLSYAGNKGWWKKSLLSPSRKFSPHLFTYNYAANTYYGIPKADIPKDPNDSMYQTTVNVFLKSKWKTKTYPICKQVLYALETVIIYNLYRFRDATKLIDMHKVYLEQYKKAEAGGTLDDLIKYIQEDKN